MIEIAVNQDYIFELQKFDKGLPIVPTVATVKIFDNGGVEVSSGSASISAIGVMSYTFTSAQNTQKAENFRIQWTYDGNIENHLFDVVQVPINNVVIDADLYTYIPEMRTKLYTYSGVTTGGSTTTIIDASLATDERDYKGGMLQVVNGADLHEARVIDFVKSSGTVTFSPARADAVIAGEQYLIRESYSTLIDVAFDDYVMRDVRAKVGIAAGYIDGKAVKKLIIFKALEIYARSMREAELDKWDAIAKDMAVNYSAELNKMRLPYDRNGDGNISEAENKNRPNFSSGMISR